MISSSELAAVNILKYLNLMNIEKAEILRRSGLKQATFYTTFYVKSISFVSLDAIAKALDVSLFELLRVKPNFNKQYIKVDYMQAFQKTLTFLKSESGMSYADLSRRVYHTATFLFNIEKKSRKLNTSQLVLMPKIFDIAYDVFLDNFEFFAKKEVGIGL